MITTIALANAFIISHNYHFFFVVGIYKIYCLSIFQVKNTVLLTIITMLYIRLLELICLVSGSLCPLTNVSLFFPHPHPC